MLVSLIPVGQLLLLSGLFLAAAFRKFKPSPRQPPSLFVIMACWSLMGFVSGCCLVAIYWTLFVRGWFAPIFSMVPAGWQSLHLLATTAGGCWGGGLLGALAGRRLWRRRLHEPR